MLLQRVVLVLESLNLPCGLELECTQTEYTIDIALPDIKLAIEVDGPLHFMRNAHKPTGRTAGMHSETLLLPFKLWPSLSFGCKAAACTCTLAVSALHGSAAKSVRLHKSGACASNTFVTDVCV